MRNSFFFGLACIGVLFAASGCSIAAAISQPPPLALEKAKIGISRPELISIIGQPTHTDVNNGLKSDYFEFVDGYPTAGKLRVILYAAADVFTLGLAEIILWPLEKLALDGREGKAIANYDAKNFVSWLKITDKDGDPWNTEKVFSTNTEDDQI